MEQNLMCQNKEHCWCLQHEFLDLMEKGGINNRIAKSLLNKIGNYRKLIDDSGFTLLHYAALYGNEEMVQHLIVKGCRVNAQDAVGVTPLKMAINVCAPKIVKLLLENGADIYITDNDGESTLEQPFKSCFSLRKQDALLILKMLFDRIHDDFIKEKATQFLLNANYETKLAILTFGNAEIIKFILENDFNIDFQEAKWGCTALHSAILLLRQENAKILIKYGANVGILDNSGRTPLRYYTNGFEDVDENNEVLRDLLKCYASLPYPRPTEVTYLLHTGKKKTVVTVLLSDVDIVMRIKQNGFLLTRLIRNRNIEVLDVFSELNIKFDVNYSTSGGRTPLITATYMRCPKRVEFLLKHGADVNLMPDGKCSAIWYAGDHEEILELLLQYGADVQYYFNEMRFIVIEFRITEIIVAQLAILQAREPPSLTRSTRKKINLNSQLYVYFQLCMKQLEELKNIKVNGAVTLFNLLTDEEEKVLFNMFNPEILSEFESALKKFSYSESHYLNKLKIRVAKLLAEVELRQKVAPVIEVLTGLCSDVHRYIIFKIISYLSRQDFHNLCELN